MDTSHDPPPALRIGRPVSQQEPHWTVGRDAQSGDPLKLGRFVLEIAVHPEGAGAELTQPAADPGQFLDLGKAARDHFALRRLVRVGA